MNRLSIIAVSGLGIAVVCIAAAAAIGINTFGSLDNMTFFDGDSDACGKADGGATSREFVWDGGDSVAISVPATVHYRRGAGDKLVAKGDPQALANLVVRDGKIESRCRHNRGEDLDITLPGREFRTYKLAGSVDMDLADLQQDRLSISVAGKGDVSATGKVDELKMEIAGKGDAHMKDLIAKTVKLEIAGRGDIETSPQDDANIEIAGSGDVKLYSEPKHLNTSIMGSGNVEHLAGQKDQDDDKDNDKDE